LSKAKYLVELVVSKIENENPNGHLRVVDRKGINTNGFETF